MQNQNTRFDWLPEQARWSYLANLGLPAVSHEKNFPKWPILFGQDGWILALFFFGKFMDLDFILIHKHAKKELGQYPAILTSHLVNDPYIIYNIKLCRMLL